MDNSHWVLPFSRGFFARLAAGVWSPDGFQYWSLLLIGVEESSKKQQRFYKYELYWAVFAGNHPLASPHSPGVSGSKMQQV
jgi:hypothetical protein